MKNTTPTKPGSPRQESNMQSLYYIEVERPAWETTGPLVDRQEFYGKADAADAIREMRANGLTVDGPYPDRGNVDPVWD
jgi:hypothetical protein